MNRLRDFPFSPQRFPIFYGWAIVVAGTLCILSSAPGQTMGVGPFTEHLMRALQLDRMQMSWSYAIGTIASGFLITPAGRLIDRYGVRIMGVIVPIAMAATLVGLSSLGPILEAVLRATNQESSTTAGFSLGVIAFFCVRFLGQGMMAMTGRVMIGKWFDRRRGMAVGIANVFVSLGFGLAPRIFNGLVEAHGWQETYRALALIIGVGMSAIAFAFFREQPEDHELFKDGYAYHDDGEGAAPKAELVDYTLGQAARSFPFWVFTAGLAAQGLVVTGLNFHIDSIAQEAGMKLMQMLDLLVPMSGLLVLTNIVAGVISDRYKLKYLLVFMMILQATGTFSLLIVETTLGKVLFIVGFGLSGGLFGLLVGTVFPRFYGLSHLGAITGLNMSVLVFSTSAGPPIFAISYSLWDSYAPAFVLCGLMPLLVAALAPRADNPQPGGI